MSDHTRDLKTDVQVSLGDIVTVSEGTPYFHDWQRWKLKVVSLRIDPKGGIWASVIDAGGKDYHRGFGVYDGETTDFDARHLTRAAPVQRSDAAEDACCKGLAPESECACMRPDWKERLAARPQCDAVTTRDNRHCPNGLEHGNCLHPDCVPSCPGRLTLAPHNQGAGK